MNNIKYLEVNYFWNELDSLYTNAFMYLEDTDQPVIPIVINSYGGEVLCLNSLLDAIKGSKKPVMTIVVGCAMSCGFQLFVSGTKGLRIVSPSATCLAHEVSGCSWGKTSDIKNDAKYIEFLNENYCYKLLDEAGNHEAGYTKKLFRDNFNADLYMNAEEVVSHNWADKIMPMNEVLRSINVIFDEFKANQTEMIDLNPLINDDEEDKCKPKK